MAAITNFIVTPLAFLSGTFYSVEALPTGLYHVTHVNPVFYLIDGARWGMIGVSDTAPGFGFLVALAATALACCLAWLLFRSGTRLKS
jgi:ABC-2 type transport system permease protein